MQIEDGWRHEDRVTGLTLTVTDGKGLDHLRITGVPSQQPRDFFFTKDGHFDGTGSMLTAKPAADPTVDRMAAAILAADIGIPTFNADYPAGMCVADCVDWLLAEVARLRAKV